MSLGCDEPSKLLDATERLPKDQVLTATTDSPSATQEAEMDFLAVIRQIGGALDAAQVRDPLSVGLRWRCGAFSAPR